MPTPNPSLEPSTSAPDRLGELVERVASEFRIRYSREPSIIAAAPGRVNLIGEHIDYNDGFVLPMAIDRYVVIAADPLTDASAGGADVYSLDLDETTQIPFGVSAEPQVPGWGRYLEGVASGFAELDADFPPFQAVLGSNVPQGGGLSSSAALEVATATLLESLSGRTLTQIDKALLCQKAEHVFAGVPCGIMDQFSSVFGEEDHLMLIDCRSQASELVSFDAKDVSVLITNSNVKHELSGGEYAARRSECDSALSKLHHDTWRDVRADDVEKAKDVFTDVEHRRARHVVSEISRTIEAAEAFRKSDWDTVGRLMYASHNSLRDDFEVSCEELDVLVEIAAGLGSDRGVIGSRMTGGGFGGCTVTLVKNEHLDLVADTIASRYASKTGIQSSSFASRPAKGTHRIRG